MEWKHLREILLNRHRDRGFGADWSKREAASVGGLFHFKRNVRRNASVLPKDENYDVHQGAHMGGNTFRSYSQKCVVVGSSHLHRCRGI